MEHAVKSIKYTNFPYIIKFQQMIHVTSSTTNTKPSGVYLPDPAWKPLLNPRGLNGNTLPNTTISR
jgi:hypothetical protein